QDVAAAGGDPAVDRHAVAFGAGPVAAHHDSAVLAVEAAVQAHAGVASGAVQQDVAAGGGDRATAGDPHANAARHAAGQRHVAVVAQDRQAGDRDAVCGIPRGGADDGDRAAIAVHFAGAVTVADQGDADGGAVAGDVDVATAAGDGAVVAELDRHAAEFPAVANQL